MGDSISRKLARWALALRYDEIPPEAIKEAKRFMIDSLGCAFASVDNHDMKQAFRYIQMLGGAPQATILGHGVKASMPDASLMNALTIRAMDYNDIYWEQDPSHPSDIIPAALATAEYKALSGKELLVGIVLCYEIEMRLCHAADPGVRERGWHHATLTQFASPLVASRMLGLSEDQAVAALGISGSSHFTLGGVVAGHLTNMKNTADPMATEAGVRAAMLASTGYTGPVELFEGKEGVFHVLNNVTWRPDWMLKDLGTDFYVTRCGYKAFPTEALTHQPITATLEVMKENGVQWQELESVLVETTTRGADILSDPSKYKPTTKETADHSLPYCIAVASVKGNVLPSDFEDEALKDNRVWDMLGRIKVVANKEIDSLFPKVKRAIVSITTKDGRTFQRLEDHAKGSPARPLSDADVVAKYKANSHSILSPAAQDRIVEATWHLDEYENVQDYVKLLVRDK